ncbi:MAG: DUF4026 domain-containing protein [Lachnospiraceae bacterium]|nr:DUF4026 domain-containing protein [Lachnospiraceae bacterium]
MQEDSYMIIIPRDPAIIYDPKAFFVNMKQKENIVVEKAGFNEKRGVEIDLKIDDRPYRIWVSPTDIEIPRFVRLGHQFTEEELKQIDAVKKGLSVNMIYEGDCRQCYYDQLRLIDAMIPDKLAVLDCPSEKLLSGRWVELTARSSVMPAPKYLFTVQAISTETEEIWLHTHGLKRCGFYELEILYSTNERSNDHYHIIETFAYRMIEAKEPIKPGDAVFVAQLDKDLYLVVTAVPWKEAIKYYPQATLGLEEDRGDEVHSEDTYVIMAYRSPQDEEDRHYTPVQVYDEPLKKNPMFYISTSETKRMSQLARERMDYMVKGFENKDNVVLAKIGVATDKNYWDESNEGSKREHIWFEVKEIQGDQITAVLTQEPYYVSGMKEGDVGHYTFDDVTDWLVFTKERRISPDDAYLL